MTDLIGQNIILGADVVIWIVFVEVPAFFALFLYMVKLSRSLHAGMEDERLVLANKYQALHDKLAMYKLDVAQRYASVVYLKDVEKRLTDHLVRIEKKLNNRFV